MSEQPYILIVDDDPDIREGITAILETRPYRLATASDGLQCMERVRAEMPDLLILDMMMPRMDGFAVIRELRDDPQYAGLPIIILTTVIEDAAYHRYELETGLAMEVQAYIEKPAAPDELIRHVAAVVTESRESGPRLVAFGRLNVDHVRTGRHGPVHPIERPET